MICVGSRDYRPRHVSWVISVHRWQGGHVANFHNWLANLYTRWSVGRTPRLQSIMQLHFWSLNSLNPASNSALSTAQLPYTAHNRLWIFPTSSFSATKNSIAARFNVCQAQTPFSQTTTAALSVGRPCTYAHGRNKHQCRYLLIFTLLSIFWNEQKNVEHYFLSNLRINAFAI